jgi:hypothetical protein
LPTDVQLVVAGAIVGALLARRGSGESG